MKTTKAKLQKEFEELMMVEAGSSTEISLISDVAAAIKENESLDEAEARFVLVAALKSINEHVDLYVEIEGMYYALLSMYYGLNGPMHIESIKKITDVIEEYAQSYKAEDKTPMPDAKFLNNLNEDFVEYMTINLGE